MKRIIVCADGTWNVQDQVNDETGTRRPTNVTKLARAVLPRDRNGIHQVVFYREGVGTGPGIDKFTGGAFGAGIEDNVVALYRSILYNYSPGDEIYIFGFSRGSFTARSLTGFMKFAGLVEKDDDYFVPDIYACYESGNGAGTAQWQKANRRIKGTRPCPEIRMIGVWDTVGSLGAPGVLGQVFNSKKYQYHRVGLFDEIKHAFHALAIDERRKPFLPTLWEPPAGWAGKLEQVWFAGVHCDVGGGYSPDGLANLALHWLVDRAAELGVEFDPVYLAPFRGVPESVLHDSMTLKYRPLGSVVRPIGLAKNGNESVHESVLRRMEHAESKYVPLNVAEFLKGSSKKVWPL